ncbi:TetR/AcrR family transcriptional regulator [Streptomyces sp. NPDC003233]
MARTEKARFTAEDWLLAALAVMTRGGVRAVRVESLAAELGATKGSFYWYFANRDAVVTAALEHWLRETTEGVARSLAELPSPEDRLRALLGTVFAARDTAPATVEPLGERRAGQPWHGLEVALQADVDCAEVRAVLAEAGRRRLSILHGLFVECGLSEPEAARTSLSGYAAYLGFLQLLRTDPDSVPSGAEREAYVESLTALLLGR